jgi:hypothetical protein
MSHSIEILVPLGRISNSILKKLPHARMRETDRLDPNVPPGLHAKKQRPKSPLTDAGFELKINVSPDGIPESITAAVDVAACLGERNTKHGFPVLVAAEASLLFIMHFLAENGIRRQEIDTLHRSDVEIQQLILTYHIKSQDIDGDLQIIGKLLAAYHPQRKVGSTKRLDGFYSEVDGLGNKVFCCEKREFGVRIYAEARDLFSSEATKVGRSHISLELILQGNELKNMRWQYPSKWGQAHECGRYEEIFVEYVLNRLFRFNEKLLETRPNATDVSLKITKLKQLLIWSKDHYPDFEVEDTDHRMTSWSLQERELQQAVADACAKHPKEDGQIEEAIDPFADF